MLFNRAAVLERIGFNGCEGWRTAWRLHDTAKGLSEHDRMVDLESSQNRTTSSAHILSVHCVRLAQPPL